MILLLVLALLAPLTTSESEGWTHLVGDSNTIYPFNPLTSNIEYKIIPLEENLANYGFSLTSRLFGDSGKLKGSVAYIVQMNGGKKNWVKVGARNVQDSMKFCFDKATMAGEGLPVQVVHDTKDGNLVTLDDKVANFATTGCKNMRFFSAMLEENAITRVQPTVFDLVGNMDSKVEVYFKIMSTVEPTEPSELTTTTEMPEIDNLVAPDPDTEKEIEENDQPEDVVSEEPVPEEPVVEEPVVEKPVIEEPVVEEPVVEVALPEESDVAVPEETESENVEGEAQPAAPVTFTGDVCSIFPQGIISTFAGESNLYDLKCSHVLAASIGNNVRGTDWFIYGTFDQFDGMNSLSAITIYLGYKVFEIQRGWTIHDHGEKFRIMEGEQAELHGCTFLFEGLHISVDCQTSGFPFRVVYDGYSVGFVEVFAEGAYDIGLCHANSDGSRSNWQVNSGREGCDISPDLVPCPVSAPECESASCDPGLVAACNELHCMGAPRDAALCSLALANQLVCGDEGDEGRDEGACAGECPADSCWRKFFVLGTGCPQAPFFTGCPVDEYL